MENIIILTVKIMLVLVDNIEVQIEKIYEVFDLIDNERADLLL